MSQPFVSITVVCYNYAHLLPRTLEAIGRQTFRDFEVIFIDNGGTDNSMEVARKFFDAHPDINATLVRNDNVDHSNAYGENLAVSLAKGKYIMFHDADDWMDDNCLELLAAEAERTDADRVICAFRDVDDSGKQTQVQSIGECRNKWYFGMQQGNLFRRSLYLENGMRTVDSVFLDAIKTFQFNYFAKNIGFVEQPCYNYLVHTDSTSRNKQLHLDMWTTPRKTFEVIINELGATYEKCIGTPDEAFAQRQIMKLYYSYIYQFLRVAPLKETMESYGRIRAMMNEKVPNYLRNPYTTLSAKSGNRFYARLVLWGSVVCEKLHIMKFALSVYHLISKFIYIPV